jgi:hypothetical protein
VLSVVGSGHTLQRIYTWDWGRWKEQLVEEGDFFPACWAQIHGGFLRIERALFNAI